jgi:hypothetical protein
MGFLTPSTIPAARFCRTISIPHDLNFLMAVGGALKALTEPGNWEQSAGGVTPEAAAEASLEMFLRYLNAMGCRVGTVFPFITTDPPEGSFELNGQTITDAETLYPDFWEVVDASLKVGSSVVLPDLRDSFLPVAGGSYTSLQTGGENATTLSDPAQNAPHTHSDVDHYHEPLLVVGPGEVPVASPALPVTNATGSSGGGGTHDNRPQFTALRHAVWVV